MAEPARRGRWSPSLLYHVVARIKTGIHARAGAREHERRRRVDGPLGAGRGRLARQLLAEGLVLAVAGGAAAILLMMVAQPPFRGVDWLMRVAAPTGPMNANRREVEAEYFNIMRIPVKQGRVFDRRDTASSDAVAIVSQSFAALRFPGQSALGQTLDLSPAPSRTIVGVVGDVRHERIDQAGLPPFTCRDRKRPRN